MLDSSTQDRSRRKGHAIMPMLAFGCIAAGISGCATKAPTGEPVVDSSAMMSVLEPGLKPEELFFPDYLLMEGVQLEAHGRIPETELVGAGMKTKQSLQGVRSRYSDCLAQHGWTPLQMEVGGHSFRLVAERQGARVELRAVQGTGPVHLFLLYQPAVERDGVQ